MSNIIHTVKEKVTGGSATKGSNPQSNKEQSFSILPHPAKTNDPADLNPPQPGGGLNSNPNMQVHHARDPHVPSQEIQNNLEHPLSREELRARAAELNK